MILPPTSPKPPLGSHRQAGRTERTEATHTAAQVTEALNTPGHSSTPQSMLRDGPPGKRSAWGPAHPGAHTYPSRLLLSSPVSMRMQYRRESQVNPPGLSSTAQPPAPHADVWGTPPRESSWST